MKDSDWRILYELHKTSNLTKTANLLFMTQPTLTKRLKQMETEWGCSIVDRTPKGLTFTAEGNFLAAQAQKYLELFHSTKEELKNSRRQHLQRSSSAHPTPTANIPWRMCSSRIR